MHGQPNTEKTIIIILDDILIAHEHLQTQLHFEDVKYAFQLLVINEAAMGEFFDLRHLHDTKLLLEHREKTLGVNFTDACKLYRGASVIMNKNRLPFDTLDCVE